MAYSPPGRDSSHVIWESSTRFDNRERGIDRSRLHGVKYVHIYKLRALRRVSSGPSGVAGRRLARLVADYARENLAAWLLEQVGGQAGPDGTRRVVSEHVKSMKGTTDDTYK